MKTTKDIDAILRSLNDLHTNGMTLTDLPNELLERIVIETLPLGFESFALTCRRFHEVSKPYIFKHNHYKKRFTCVRLLGNRPGLVSSEWDTIHPLELLKRIRIDPIIARYVRKVFFKTVGQFRDNVLDHNAELFQQYGLSDECFSFLCDLPQLRDAGLDKDEWVRFMSKGSLLHASVILLAHFTNLQVLGTQLVRGHVYRRVSEEKYGVKSSWDVLEKTLSSILYGNPELGIPSATPNLIEIIPSPRSNREVRPILNDTALFLLMPSVKKWTGYMYECYPPRVFAWPINTALDSTIEVMTLGMMYVAIDVVAEFFSRFPSLETLRWHQNVVVSSIDKHFWDAGKFVQILSDAPCKLSLQTLSISMTIESGHKIQFAVKDFRSFECLRHLEVHVRCFTGRLLSDSGSDFDSDSASTSLSPKFEELPQDVYDNGGGFFDERISFMDMFPESLETLTILVTASNNLNWSRHANATRQAFLVFNAAIAARLMTGFGSWRRYKLPYLKVFTVAGKVPEQTGPKKIFEDSLAAIRRETKLAGVDFVHNADVRVVRHVDDRNRYLLEAD